MITVTYDQEANMTYVKLNEGDAYETIIGPGETYNVDLDQLGAVVGVEYFGPPASLRADLLNDKYDELWTDLFDFVQHF